MTAHSTARGGVSAHRKVYVGDGTELAYTQAGRGRPVVLVHGWCQSTATWTHQLDGLSGRCRVIAYDQRAHGRSAKPAHGHTIHRLAADLHDLLTGLDLGNVVLVGHSMGCSVAWAYLELFGPDRLAALVLADGAPCLTSRPGWPAGTRADAGAIFTPTQLARTCAALTRPGDPAVAARAVTDSMLTPAASTRLREQITRQNVLVPRDFAAKLLFHHASMDWRDLIPRIRLPVLVTGGPRQPHPMRRGRMDRPPHPWRTAGDLHRERGRPAPRPPGKPRQVQPPPRRVHDRHRQMTAQLQSARDAVAGAGEQ